MSSDKLTWTLTGATVACVLAVYVASAPRAVPGGDSGRTPVSHMCLCLYHTQPITEQQYGIITYAVWHEAFGNMNSMRRIIIHLSRRLSNSITYSEPKIYLETQTRPNMCEYHHVILNQVMFILKNIILSTAFVIFKKYWNFWLQLKLAQESCFWECVNKWEGYLLLGQTRLCPSQSCQENRY